MEWEIYMRRCLELAREAAELGEIPVGAVVVRDGVIIGEGLNRRETDRDATGHAEMLALRAACRALDSWRLTGCTLYVTLEPCPMCTGAILQSRISTVVFGAFDPKAGCCGSLLNLPQEDFESRPAVYGGVLEEECGRLMEQFFEKMRK